MTRTSSRSAILVAFLAALSAILGIGRESYIAYSYGATGYTDAFYIASIVPDMIASWISYTLTNSLIPVLKNELCTSRVSAKRLIGAVFWDAFILLAVMTVLGVLIRSMLVSLLASHFTQVQHIEAVRLLQIMMISVLFSGLSGVLWGIHNAHENFSYPALVGIVYNILLLIVASALRPLFGIESLAYGFLAGTIGRFLVQFIPLVMRGQFGTSRSLWHPGMKRIIRSMGPIFMSLSVGTLNLIVDRILATGLKIGQLSDMNFATKIGVLPSNMIGMAIATVLYTRFITNYQKKDNAELKRIVSEGYGWLIFVGVLVASGFIIYASDIVAALYHRGAFNAFDVHNTETPLLIYGWFGVFYLITPLISHFFFAREENIFVMRSSLLTVAVNITGSLLLVGHLGISGLVLANAISQVVYVILQTEIMLRRLQWRKSSFLYEILRRSLPPSLAFAIGTIIAAIILPEHGYKISSLTGLIRCLYGMTLGTVTFLIYVFIARQNMISLFVWGIFHNIACRFKQVER